MGHLPEREVCYMRRQIDFDKIGITDDVMFCTVLRHFGYGCQLVKRHLYL